ncbi:hypothetical protein N7488_005600 [Penicillium malachiteum]|nr:hypothetical protein N7488_005600 [Penicillium malachiteum]
MSIPVATPGVIIVAQVQEYKFSLTLPRSGLGYTQRLSTFENSTPILHSNQTNPATSVLGNFSVFSQVLSMHLSLSIVEKTGPGLYLGVEATYPLFQEENHQPSQVWDLAPAGEGIFTIQNTETGTYINCGTYGGICELKEEGQIFREKRRYEDRDIYSITEQSSSKLLTRTEEGAIYLAAQEPDPTNPEPFYFWLTRSQCK